MSAPALLGPGEGVSNHKRFRIKAGLEQLVLTEIDHTPGEFQPPPHVHHHHADAFYVLEGEMLFLLGDEEHVLGANQFVFAPPELVHCYRSPGSRPARMLNIHAPGMGFDRRLLGEELDFDQHPPPADGGLPASAGRAGRTGERLRLGASEALILAGGSDGIGSLTVVEMEVAPGFAGPPPHLHDKLIDSFYVLEGTLHVRLGEESLDAEAGSYALVPPGTLHTFSNPSDAPARVLNVQAPGGLDAYLRELAAAPAAASDPASIAQIAAKYDIRFA